MFESTQPRRRSSGKRLSNKRKRSKRASLDPIDALLKFSDFNEVFDAFNQWLVQKGKNGTQTNLLLFGSLVLGSFFALFMSAFAVIIPLAYGVLGYALHKREGWEFYQPGVGGVRFIALQGVAWSFYALTLVLHLINLFTGDFGLHLTAIFTGFLSLTFMLTSLMTYNGPNTKNFGSVEASKKDEEYEWMEEDLAPEFNEKIQKSIIMMSGDNPSGMWWVFVAMEAALAFMTAWIMVINDRRGASGITKVVTALMGLSSLAATVPVTHAIGGKWKNIKTSWTSFQPGVGGASFVSLQATGWTLYGLTLLMGVLAIASNLKQATGGKAIIPFAMGLTGLLGLTAEALIMTSLFSFKETSRTSSNPLYKKSDDVFQDSLLKMLFGVANVLFAPQAPRPNWQNKNEYTRDPMLYSRSPTLKSPDDHWKADERWEECISSTSTTGDQYLIVGVGFVGKRLVNRLLERGETKIRIFDIAPHNPFEGDDRVEYIRGDVTKLDDISVACEGVDTIYATFALIRFMDRLDHQAWLSYHVNVTGTKVLFEAIKKHNISKVVVTSSSHGTTDEHSLPRLNRDENAPYVTRETAHNHYGWTKALADKFALKQNGEELSNGEILKVCIVRPCSGVFGADDRLSFEKCFDMGVAPGIGIDSVMDWVYVENVVLGHLLAEARLQDDTPGVAGEAFNISNNDATSWLDFWFMAKKIASMNPPKMANATNIEFVFVPMSLIWAVAYVSEACQRVFKGRVSLGRDVDSLTPAMLQTAMMTYSYNSDKAERVLGYKPAFTLEEGVQRSVYEYYHNKCVKN